jgi:hypothetical protein
MFFLLLLAVIALLGIVTTIVSVVSDSPRRVPTRYSQLLR